MPHRVTSSHFSVCLSLPCIAINSLFERPKQTPVIPTSKRRGMTRTRKMMRTKVCPPLSSFGLLLMKAPIVIITSDLKRIVDEVNTCHFSPTIDGLSLTAFQELNSILVKDLPVGCSLVVSNCLRFFSRCCTSICYLSGYSRFVSLGNNARPTSLPLQRFICTMAVQR
jgi:hypothetical protein